MKKYLLGLLLAVSTVANAVTWEMPNQSGGRIVLTDRMCIQNGKTYEKLNDAYAYDSNGTVISGCWFMQDNLVNIIWAKSGDHKVYSPNDFTKVNSGKSGTKNTGV